MTVALDIYGNGQVAQALIALLPPHIRVRRVQDSAGVVYEDAGVTGTDIVVDCTSPVYTGPAHDDWNAFIQCCLDNGRRVVTCNKPPACDSDLLHHPNFRASATVGGGTPLLPCIQRLAPQIQAIQLVASGTLSSVCHDVGAGRSVAEAVRRAQDQGFAEPDPQLDLDGTDTLAKAVILHNMVWPDAPVSLSEISGRLHIHPGPIQAIVADGGTPRAVASIRRGDIQLRVRDAPWATVPGHATARIHADGVFLVSGPGAGAKVTARNLLADIEAEWATQRVTLESA